MAIYLLRNNEIRGPFEETLVARWLLDGACSPTDLARRDGVEEWQPLSTIPLHQPSKLEQIPPSGNSPGVLVGVLLLAGAGMGLCAGGGDPSNPSIASLLVLLLGGTGAFLAIYGKARRTILTFVILSLVLTGLKVMIGPRHWSLGGVWVYDIVAPLLLVIALFAANPITLDQNKDTRSVHSRPGGRRPPWAGM